MKTIETVNEYDAQAEMFLSSSGVKFRAVRKADRCPLWDTDKHIHGDRYLVTFSRIGGDSKFPGGPRQGRAGSKFSLSFWNSKDDADNGETTVRPYSVLSCIQKSDPGDFMEFCDEFGYSWDSIAAKKTWTAVVQEWKKIKAFFTEKEIEALQEIA